MQKLHFTSQKLTPPRPPPLLQPQIDEVGPPLFIVKVDPTVEFKGIQQGHSVYDTHKQRTKV